MKQTIVFGVHKHLLTKLLTIILLVIVVPTKAQFYSGANRWNIGINIGIDRQFGDVSPQNNPIFANPLTVDFYKDRRLAVSMNFGKEIASFWFVRLNAMYCNLQARNNSLGYRSDVYHIHEFSLLNTIDLFGCFPRVRDIEYWDFNLIIGAEVLSYRSKLTDMETDRELYCVPSNFHKENMSFKRIFSLPFGIGFGYQFAKNWKFNFATIYRCVFDDEFDGQVSDRKKMEGFAFLQVGVNYYFDMRFSARSTEDNLPLEKKSPNYKYIKQQLKNGRNPVNTTSSTTRYKKYYKRNRRR